MSLGFPKLKKIDLTKYIPAVIFEDVYNFDINSKPGDALILEKISEAFECVKDKFEISKEKKEQI